jgi:hypothetical protein
MEKQKTLIKVTDEELAFSYHVLQFCKNHYPNFYEVLTTEYLKSND